MLWNVSMVYFAVGGVDFGELGIRSAFLTDAASTFFTCVIDVSDVRPRSSRPLYGNVQSLMGCQSWCRASTCTGAYCGFCMVRAFDAIKSMMSHIWWLLACGLSTAPQRKVKQLARDCEVV